MAGGMFDVLTPEMAATAGRLRNNVAEAKAELNRHDAAMRAAEGGWEGGGRLAFDGGNQRYWAASSKAHNALDTLQQIMDQNQSRYSTDDSTAQGDLTRSGSNLEISGLW